MKIPNPVDWYEAFKGNRYHLPGSQGQGIQLVQQILVPLQAEIALISGRYAGDALALKFYVNADVIMCERCLKTFTKSGSGHDTSCELFKRAQEVLMSDEGECEKSLLLAEQERLAARLDRTNRQLARIDARKGQ